MEKNTTKELQKNDGQNNDNEIVCLLCNDTGIIEEYDGTDFGDWEKVGERMCACTN